MRRDLERIFFPRRRVRDWALRPVWWAEDWWSRHVRHRELHRMFDVMRARVDAATPPEWRTPEHARRGLQRLRSEHADHKREVIRRAVAEAGPDSLPPGTGPGDAP